jgi:broad specificity phosphatase PhoE
MEQQQAGTLILVRHGETDANRRRCFAESSEIPLNENGLLQASHLGAQLAREFRPELLVSSDFLRARQTSDIIADALGLKTEVIAGIHERDFGCLKGHPYERMGKAMALDVMYDSARSWMWTPAGGESLEDVRVRGAAVLERLREEHPGKQAVVVCHGAVIQAMCAHITGDWNEAWVPPNCGIVIIDYLGARWKQPVVQGDWECIPTHRISRL